MERWGLGRLANRTITCKNRAHNSMNALNFLCSINYYSIALMTVFVNSCDLCVVGELIS